MVHSRIIFHHPLHADVHPEFEKVMMLPKVLPLHHQLLKIDDGA